MEALLSIGHFSKTTYLSVKALRHYHDVGLLVPAVVDETTGYRYYEASQVPVGQVVRRFRDLGMTLDQIRAILRAPDVATRGDLITAHLTRMESELERTQAAVASLRTLLERSPSPVSVEYRHVPAAVALAISEPVGSAEIDRWWVDAFSELGEVLRRSGAEPTGPAGALYPDEYFEAERGEVVAFLPVAAAPTARSARTAVVEIPPAELAVTLHRGPFSELDAAYGALGTYVAERAIGVDGPIREYYLVTGADTSDESRHRTEVCWPVFQTTQGGSHS